MFQEYQTPCCIFFWSNIWPPSLHKLPSSGNLHSHLSPGINRSQVHRKSTDLYVGRCCMQTHVTASELWSIWYVYAKAAPRFMHIWHMKHIHRIVKQYNNNILLYVQTNLAIACTPGEVIFFTSKTPVSTSHVSQPHPTNHVCNITCINGVKLV